MGQVQFQPRWMSSGHTGAPWASVLFDQSPGTAEQVWPEPDLPNSLFIPPLSTALLSASSYTLQSSMPHQCSLLVVQAPLKRASRSGRDLSQIPVRADIYSHGMRLPSTVTCQSGSACHFTLNDDTSSTPSNACSKPLGNRQYLLHKQG